MSFWDYVLPWKSIPKMADDVEAAWKGEGKNRHDSVFGAIGKYADPFGALLGKDVQNFMHGTIPREVNRAMEPAVQFGHNLNPLYHAGKSNNWDGVNEAHEFGSNKGGDVLAAVLGAIYGGGALMGASGGGASGGGGGFQAPWSQNYGAMDWGDPSTYMNLYQQYGGLLPKGQQQQQQTPPPMAQRGLLSSEPYRPLQDDESYMDQFQQSAPRGGLLNYRYY